MRCEEREGGGEVRTRQERSGVPAPARTYIPDALPPLPAEAAHQGTAPVGPTRSPPGETNLGGPEVHKIVTKGNIHSAHRDLLRTPGPVYSLSANIEQGAVIT